MLPPFGDKLSDVSDRTFAGMPRYLRTLSSYYFMGPRRFFLKSELASDVFMAPWRFFLINVSIGAALAAALVLLLDVKAAKWDWDLYKDLFVFALIQDLLLLPCGLIAAWLAVQRVSVEPLLIAYANASAWRLVTMPAFIYIAAAIGHRHSSETLGLLALAVLVAYDVYLILGMAAHNFIEGRARWSFVILTTLFLALSQGAIAVAFLVPEGARNFMLAAMDERITGKDRQVWHCDNAVIEGNVEARGNDTLVYFEWGDTPAMGHTTRPRRYLDDGPAFEPLVNLHENTRYYYRIAVKSTYGVSHGKVETFVTSACNKPVAGSEEIE